ncbi:hypothetical protein ACFSKM_01450 [Ancylobacter dichloromethanicus]
MNVAAYLAPGLLALALAACAAPTSPVVEALPPPSRDTLYEPDRVQPGRLEYAPDRTTFAPILTERFVYPTQAQANDAYRRLLGDDTIAPSRATSVWLFGCRPGALDAQTARVSRYRGPVVHCATDFSRCRGADASGARPRTSIITALSGTCSRSIRREPLSPGAAVSARRKTRGAGSRAAIDTNSAAGAFHGCDIGSIY